MHIVAITGASGAIYGIRLIEVLLEQQEKTGVIISEAGWSTIEYELYSSKKSFSSIKELLRERNKHVHIELLSEFKNNDFFTLPASGTSEFQSITVIPCSMKTLSAIAHSYSESLITRACDVALKEKRLCIIVPRESPLHNTHLKNMLEVSQNGGIIVPPVPAMYQYPETVEDIINTTVGKICNLLHIEHSLFTPWQGENSN